MGSPPRSRAGGCPTHRRSVQRRNDPRAPGSCRSSHPCGAGFPPWVFRRCWDIRLRAFVAVAGPSSWPRSFSLVIPSEGASRKYPLVTGGASSLIVPSMVRIEQDHVPIAASSAREPGLDTQRRPRLRRLAAQPLRVARGERLHPARPMTADSPLSATTPPPAATRPSRKSGAGARHRTCSENSRRHVL